MQCLCNAFIENRTGRTVDAVTLIHKFGDDPAQVLVWDRPLKDGWRSASNPEHVSYRTGFGNMTSYDWWGVSWRSGNRIHTSNPSALGYIAGFFAGIGPGLVGSASTIAKPALGTGAGIGFASAMAVAGYAVQLATGGMPGTKELKEHMLHESDQGSGITVILGEREVTLSTADGRRTTMEYTSARVPKAVEAASVSDSEDEVMPEL